MTNKERVLIKLSGAALKGDTNDSIFSTPKLINLAMQIKTLSKQYKIAIVVGGGNIWRGNMFDKKIWREEKAHYMGMVATIINAVALQEALLKNGVNTEIHSLLSCPAVAKDYTPTNVNKALNQNKVIILAGGTGKPFFTTDTGAAKNAAELKMQWIFMAKDGVDGVYSTDPKKNKSAKRFSHLTFQDAIKMKLQIMDMAAMHICQEKSVNILVFNMKRHNAIINATKRLIPTTIIDNK